ncbi:MAG TPA: potassium channel family protein [Candidatus Baltobacteraceae bacterium]|nr:potassium channel family protein [Candidatus Baltobacteraceae bacterium]
MILSVVFGLLIITNVLWEAFETIILPRRVNRRWRVTVLFYRGTWRPWRSIARWFKKVRARETFLSFYGPLSLLTLLVFWATSLIVGFALLLYGVGHQVTTARAFETCLYLSGTTFFTLGLGDVVPHTSAGRFLAVVESGLGFGFLALVLSYLPVIYQAFSRREVNIVLLDARAGSPPTAGELLRRHAEPDGMESLQRLLHSWERAAAEILESHVSYPAVTYFRSQHNNESWLASLTAILDTSALLIAGVENACARQARLTFAICRHTVVDLAQLFNAVPRPVTIDRLPPAELERMQAMLSQAGLKLSGGEAAAKKLAKLRDMYEPYVEALSRFFYMDLPPWIVAREIADNWKTSAWGRISGFTVASRQEPDDHSD